MEGPGGEGKAVREERAWRVNLAGKDPEGERSCC